MLVPIKNIHPNPYRDFTLYPYDEEQITKLISSFEENGDWGSLPARPNGTGSTYEIAAGHHRVEALRRLGIKEVDLKIADFDDDQMISIMVRENATQRGQNAGAILDSVAAAMYRVAYITLTSEWKHNWRILQLWYPNEKGFDTARGKIESGQGVGREALTEFLPSNALTETEIKNAIATIKGSDIHQSIMERVKATIERERKEAEKKAETARKAAEAAERERKAAEERAAAEAAAHKARLAKIEAERAAAKKAAAEAKAKADREIAEKREQELAARAREERERNAAHEELRKKREAEARRLMKERDVAVASAQTTASAAQRAIKASEGVDHKMATGEQGTFDARCATLFKNDYQLSLFRKIVTKADVREILSKDNQYPFAQKCLQWHKQNDVHMTEKSVAEWVNNEIGKFAKMTRGLSKDEERRIKIASAHRRIERYYDEFRDGITKMISAGGNIAGEFKTFEGDDFPRPSAHVVELVHSGSRLLSELSKRLKL